MFVRDKRIGRYTYVYLVENVREGGRTKQRIIANLGRKETVLAHGDLDRLARSVSRLAQRSMVLSVDQGEAPPDAACRRIGPALLFDRLWQEAGCRAVLTALAGRRQFAFAVERAVFLTVLHRLFVSGSDRAAEKWRADHRIDGTEGLQLHHLYRAMAWLGEPLADQKGASGLAPRCRKDLVEEELFTRRRDLFAELSVVFMDTTSLSFEGRGGAELGRRGHSKDFRPDLNQMIVGLVIDQDGRPAPDSRQLRAQNHSFGRLWRLQSRIAGTGYNPNCPFAMLVVPFEQSTIAVSWVGQDLLGLSSPLQKKKLQVPC